MKRSGLAVSLLSITLALGYATFSAAGTPPTNAPTMPAPNLPTKPGPVAPTTPPAASPYGDCVHTTFKTELVKNACIKGGQKEAKDVMKAFMKDKKIKSCNACHSKLAPKYDLKADGFDQFQKAGGK